MINTAVILTVFNRREVTLKGLESLYKAIDYLGEGYHFDIYMTDDGCTDGTSEAIRKEFPNVHILFSAGDLYWNGGMCKAWQAACNSGLDYDFYMWFNDDDDLYKDALVTMFKSYQIAGGDVVISGVFIDESGNVSYGGWMNDVLVPLNKSIQSVEMINGNLVLVPKVVHKKIGGLDPHFIHSFGDWEYGIRARKSGFSLCITSSCVGTCNRHDSIRKCFNSQVALFERIRNLYSSKSPYLHDILYYRFKTKSFFCFLKTAIAIHARCLFPSFWN